MTLWERLWYRRRLDILVAAKTSPFAGGPEEDKPSGALDATEDDIWDKLKAEQMKYSYPG